MSFFCAKCHTAQCRHPLWHLETCSVCGTSTNCANCVATNVVPSEKTMACNEVFPCSAEGTRGREKDQRSPELAALQENNILSAKLDQATQAKESAVAMSEERLARALRAEDRITTMWREIEATGWGGRALKAEAELDKAATRTAVAELKLLQAVNDNAELARNLAEAEKRLAEKSAASKEYVARTDTHQASLAERLAASEAQVERLRGVYNRSTSCSQHEEILALRAKLAEAEKVIAHHGAVWRTEADARVEAEEALRLTTKQHRRAEDLLAEAEKRLAEKTAASDEYIARTDAHRAVDCLAILDDKEGT